MNTCPRCGSEFTETISGSSLTLICEQCGYGIATTWTEPINEDETDYTLTLLPGNALSKPLLSAISGICTCNFLAARKIILNDTPTPIATAKAPEMKKLVDSLKSCEGIFSISPDFPY